MGTWVDGGTELDDLTEDDTVLPSQFFVELKLPLSEGVEFFAAMLKRAVDDYRTALYHRDTEEAKRLEAWFANEPARLNFDTVCEKLNLEPDYVRRLVREVRAAEAREATA